ncbi:MAG: carbonic anhydrase [Gemmatimonadales bacterium]|nr:MAG: carbonic anhydrase [Gemmatimonadales bacterium]
MTDELLDGLGEFRAGYFAEHRKEYRDLVFNGQHPSTLFVGCSDSRVSPQLLTGAGPGELFVVRNVGNLIPPPDKAGGPNGISAALEYAVDILEVEEIIVCGHSHCGAVRALYDPPDGASPNLREWLELAGPARLPGPPDDAMLRETERRSVKLQLQRLLEFPNVRRRVDAGRLDLHGWHYVIEDGEVHLLNVSTGAFVPHRPRITRP